MRIIVARPPTDVEAKSRPADVEQKTATVPAGIAAVGTTQLIEADKESGRVTAIVGVTGIVDHVDDLIVPGAYTKTLGKRRPKVCFNHSWNDPIGRVVGIEEWLPGDPRFAEVGVLLDGKAWPAEAGALVATMEFNTKSERARDAYETVVFFSESGECEWSIGWNPVSGKAFKRKDGVRVCAEVELFEVSPVLFGAAPLTRTLSLKDASALMMERKSLQARPDATEGLMDVVEATFDLDAVLEGKALPTFLVKDEPVVPQPTESTDDGDEDFGQLHAAAMDEIDWDEVSAAAAPAPPPPAAPPPPPPGPGGGAPPPPAPGDGTAPEAKTAEEEDVDKPVQLSTEAKALFNLTADDILNGTIDLTALVDQNIGLQAKVDGLTEIKAEGGADQNRGNAENLRRSYVSGKLAAQIRWGQDGDFMRCVRIAGKHMRPDQAKGYCNLRHKDATGAYPGHAPGEKKSLGLEAAELIADTWNPLVEVGDWAGSQPAVEAKSIEGALPGSLEERRDLVRRKLEPMLRALHEPESPSKDTVTVGGGGCWIDIVGTWEDRVIATVHAYPEGEPPLQASYEVDYTIEGETVILGEPEPVELRVTIERADGDTDEDEDAEESEIQLADLLPIADLIGITTAGVKSMMAVAPETKAGRVLSGSNESRLRGAIEHLLAVLAAAGVKVSGTDDASEAQRASSDAEVRDTTAPGTPMAAGVEAKALTPGDIDSVLADLGV